MKPYICAGLCALSFGAGGFLGWWLTREKESTRADREIMEVQAYYKRINEEKKKKEEEEKQEKEQKDLEEKTAEYAPKEAAMANREKPDISEYKARTSPKDDVKYSSYFVADKTEKKADHPYVITDAEFGEFEDYATIGLLYFKDGFVAEEDGTLVDNLFETCGTEFKDILDSGEDQVFVRNDARRCDYEIIRDIRFYEDYISALPPRRVTIE
jgi:hypothetical protein